MNIYEGMLKKCDSDVEKINLAPYHALYMILNLYSMLPINGESTYKKERNLNNGTNLTNFIRQKWIPIFLTVRNVEKKIPCKITKVTDIP